MRLREAVIKTGKFAGRRGAILGETNFGGIFHGPQNAYLIDLDFDPSKGQNENGDFVFRKDEVEIQGE